MTQTDTTVGFLSQNDKKLYEIKSRKDSKPFIKVYSNFKSLLSSGTRIPNKFKNNVRRSTRTTFIVKNQAFRVANIKLHSEILRKTKWNFSTSANQAGKNFDREFCEKKADIIIEDINGLDEKEASNIFKINQIKRRKLR